MAKFRFHWIPDDINHICYFVDATTEPPLYILGRATGMAILLLSKLKIWRGLGNLSIQWRWTTLRGSYSQRGTGNWYLTVNYDSGDILGINGRISTPRNEEEMKICDPIHEFFKPIIAKYEIMMEEVEATQKKTSQSVERNDSGRKEEQSEKSITRKWWQFWK